MDITIPDIIYWLWGWAVLALLVIIIYGGVKYFLARGNKEKKTRAGKMFIYGLASLLVLFFLYVFSLPTSEPLLY